MLLTTIPEQNRYCTIVTYAFHTSPDSNSYISPYYFFKLIFISIFQLSIKYNTAQSFLFIHSGNFHPYSIISPSGKATSFASSSEIISSFLCVNLSIKSGTISKILVTPSCCLIFTSFVFPF